MFAAGDRIQFRAPCTEHRIANGELGSIGKITEEELMVVLDSGREVSFEPDKFRHLDHGYAVTSYSSQSQTVDRVLVNADANESDLLLNQRMGYVAVSRAREEAKIFTNSMDQLRDALDRNVDKELAVEALRQSSARDALSHEELWRLASSTNSEANTEQSYDIGPINEDVQDRNGREQAAIQEIEFGLD